MHWKELIKVNWWAIPEEFRYIDIPIQDIKEEVYWTLKNQEVDQKQKEQPD